MAAEMLEVRITLYRYPERRPSACGTYAVQKRGCFGLYRNVWNGTAWKYKRGEEIVAWGIMPVGAACWGSMTKDIYSEPLNYYVPVPDTHYSEAARDAYSLGYHTTMIQEMRRKIKVLQERNETIKRLLVQCVEALNRSGK